MDVETEGMTAAEDSAARADRKMDELHKDVVGVRIALAELTAEVKASNAAQLLRDQAVTDHEQRLRALEDRPASPDHEARIRALEGTVPDDLPRQLEDGKRFRWMLVGGALAVGGAAGGVAGVLAKLL